MIASYLIFQCLTAFKIDDFILRRYKTVTLRNFGHNEEKYLKKLSVLNLIGNERLSAIAIPLILFVWIRVLPNFICLVCVL